MEIKKIDIEYFKKGGMTSSSCECVRHIKILPYLSVVQSVEGSYDISLGSSAEEKTGEGGFFIAPAEIQQTITHHISGESGRMICRWIFIDVLINGQYKLDSVFRFPTTVKGETAQRLAKCFDRLFNADGICTEYICCYEIIGILLDMAVAADEAMPAAIERAIEHMIKNYTDQMTVSRLSKIATMSEPNFYASFKRAVGAPPITYLNRYRLSLAAERLINTDLPIGEIAYSVGIRDALYFGKLFKRTYGVTPRQYREEHSER